MKSTLGPSSRVRVEGTALDLDGLMGSPSSGSSAIMISSPFGDDDWRNKELWGSDFFKQGRNEGLEEQGWKRTETPRAETMLVPQTMESAFVVRSSSGSGFLGGEKMLSFSSPSEQDNLMPCGYGSLNCHHLPSSPLSHSSTVSSYGWNSVSALDSGSYNLDLQSPTGGGKGVFTPSQWMELENQTVIYKCLAANAPIPPSLLVSAQKSLRPIGYCPYSAASLRPTHSNLLLLTKTSKFTHCRKGVHASFLGWGSFPLGFSKSCDQEPGRCRRTDGKKWRCSRDAVADQKYCERHLNRSRYRSRKPVEGQCGHDNARPSISLPVASTINNCGLSNNVTDTQHEMKSSRLSSVGPSSTPLHRTLINKKLNESQEKPLEKYSSKAEIGPFSSYSHVNQSGSSHSENQILVSYPEISDQEPNHISAKHFTHNWFENQSDCSNCIWPEITEAQLCISIPKISSDVSYFQLQEDMILSSLRQFQDSDLIHLGLGGGDAMNNLIQKQASWAPNSWEASIGGPLGEVLNTNVTSKNISSSNTTTQNLLSYGWSSTPTGVLQKTEFGSLSSSTGSSPRVSSLCDNLLRSAFSN